MKKIYIYHFNRNHRYIGRTYRMIQEGSKIHLGPRATRKKVDLTKLTEHRIALFRHHEWKYVDDYRGPAWDKVTLTEEQIVKLGPLPDNLTHVKPPYAWSAWKNGKWVQSRKLFRQTKIKALNRIFRQKTLHLGSPADILEAICALARNSTADQDTITKWSALAAYIDSLKTVYDQARADLVAATTIKELKAIDLSAIVWPEAV